MRDVTQPPQPFVLVARGSQELAFDGQVVSISRRDLLVGRIPLGHIARVELKAPHRRGSIKIRPYRKYSNKVLTVTFARAQWPEFFALNEALQQALTVRGPVMKSVAAPGVPAVTPPVMAIHPTLVKWNYRLASIELWLYAIPLLVGALACAGGLAWVVLH